MENDKFILTQGLGQQLEFAFRRNGWDAAQVHTLCQGDLLGLVRQFMLKPNDPPADLRHTLNQNPLFVPWKTITIGKRRSMEELINALVEEKYPIECALKLLRHPSITLAKVETEVHLAKLTLENFGFTDYLNYTAMCRRLKKMGFELGTAEIAAELRLNFDEQEDMGTVMAMEPIDGEVLDLYLDDDEGSLELFAEEISDYKNYSPGCLEYVCVIPKNA
jgi:hypothetical protein